MTTRVAILETLTKQQLFRLAQKFGLEVSARDNKACFVKSLAGSRRFNKAEMVGHLTVSELRQVCAKLGKATNGTKPFLIHQLTGDKQKLLGSKIVASLKKQGFKKRGSVLIPPSLDDKSAVRKLHEASVQHKRDRSSSSLSRHEVRLLSRFANGSEVEVENIKPMLVEVKRGTEDELLFRYACLHWSIPVSSGYGRRLRFLVIDQHNGKLIGVLGLGDPVYALSARDKWIGFSQAGQKQRLRNIIDAFVLGAVPPYSTLLCGKLVAMLAASNEVRERFRQKYKSRKSVISETAQDGELAMLTTTSALGRSSVYNRLRFKDHRLFVPVGYTQGYGDFQFLNGLYDELFTFAKETIEPTAKQDNWGGGFRNRREVVKKCLACAGLPEQLLRHGVKRQIFLVPLATNSAEFLRGESDVLESFDYSAASLFDHFMSRWLRPRIDRVLLIETFDPNSLRLWK